MAKLKHQNLFGHGDKSDVYAALQRDYDRDSWTQAFWHLAFVGSALGATFLAGHKDWLWLFAGLYCIERCIARYVDNSNRNWAMHVMDWIDNSRDGAT